MTFVIQKTKPQGEIEKENGVRFVGYANGSQSKHVLSNNSDSTNKSPGKTGQNKWSLNQNQKNCTNKVTGKRI